MIDVHENWFSLFTMLAGLDFIYLLALVPRIRLRAFTMWQNYRISLDQRVSVKWVKMREIAHGWVSSTAGKKEKSRTVVVHPKKLRGNSQVSRRACIFFSFLKIARLCTLCGSKTSRLAKRWVFQWGFELADAPSLFTCRKNVLRKCYSQLLFFSKMYSIVIADKRKFRLCDDELTSDADESIKFFSWYFVFRSA